MSGSALRYLKRHSEQTKKTKDSGTNAEEFLILDPEEQTLISFQHQVETTISKELQFRLSLPGLEVISTIGFLLIALMFQTALILALIPIQLLLLRMARWTSLRREFGKLLYPTRTFIGAIFAPGTFKD